MWVKWMGWDGHRSAKITFGANKSRVGSAFGDISGFYARRYGGAPF